MRTLAMSLLFVFASACTPSPKQDSTTPDPPGGDPNSQATTPTPAKRVPALKEGAADYARFEGTDFHNDCTEDSGCYVAGSSGEVCSAEPGVMTAADAKTPPAGASCGCVETQCVWYSMGGAATTTGGGEGEGAGQGQPCADGRCTAGLTCKKYYGVAGPRGPEFSSCEIPCTGPKGTCPGGQKCVTISDGPGSVCR
jgi:hypothetical protein